MDRFQEPSRTTKVACMCCDRMFSFVDSNGFCRECADETLSPCCGVTFDEDIRICPKCKEQV